MKKETYKMVLYCKNCKSEQECEIKKGHSVNYYCANGECPNCGCNTLIESEDKIIDSIYKTRYSFVDLNDFMNVTECVWDNVEDGKPIMISCSCKKCSPKC